MKGRLTIAIFALVVLGGAIWLSSNERNAQVLDVAPLPSLPPTEVRAVEIDVPGRRPLHFRRNKGQWQLVERASRAVDAQAMGALLRDLGTMRPLRTVAMGAQYDERLGLDKAHRLLVRLEGAQGQRIAFAIGKQGRDLTSTFLRPVGWHKVVAVDKVLRWQLQRTPDAWLAPQTEDKKGDKASHD